MLMTSGGHQQVLLFGRNETLPSLVIVIDSDFSDMPWWFVNIFYFFPDDFLRCASDTIAQRC